MKLRCKISTVEPKDGEALFWIALQAKMAGVKYVAVRDECLAKIPEGGPAGDVLGSSEAATVLRQGWERAPYWRRKAVAAIKRDLCGASGFVRGRYLGPEFVHGGTYFVSFWGLMKGE